jgi:NRAMP (natural resistance-associated macrophage protein)-like metal ion transporter
VDRVEKNKRNDGAPLSKPTKSIIQVLRSLGPGLITGASDDDPSGIATYSQAGAKFGFGMLWMVLFQYPMMIVVQEMCARIGLVTGGGLAAVIKKKYSRKIVLPIVSLLLFANTINIGADIGAMAASIRLIFPGFPAIAATLAFAVFIIAAEIFIPYRKYSKVLRYLTLSLFAYFITAVIVGGNWIQIAAASFVPHIEFNSQFAMMFVAILGTTISPYLFFWQASEEAEEDVAKHKIKEVSGSGSATKSVDRTKNNSSHGTTRHKERDSNVNNNNNGNNDNKKPKISKTELKLMRSDVAVGMGFSLSIMWAIIVTTAGSLHVNGITDIQTADQAARALQPLAKSFPFAGEMAKTIFALGIIGSGLITIPVLAGSSGYALSDVFGWKEGLSKKFRQAKGFYLIIAASTLVGLWINFANIDPIKALVYTAVINGVIAAPILYIIMRTANDKNILGKKVNGKSSNVIGWLTFTMMSVSVVIMFLTWRGG